MPVAACRANRELRRAKSHVQKWERVCAALGAEQVPGYYTADEFVPERM
ncbi:DUF1627 domain-containing protein [Escherichia coli]